MKPFKKGKETLEALKEMKVLLVDDDESIRVSMGYYFKGKTAAFTAVESAETGLEMIREMGDVDIVIVDYQLPGMNGLSFLETVRKCLPNAFTVLITAHANLELNWKAGVLGVDAFIQKPFTTKTIMEALMPVRESA